MKISLVIILAILLAASLLAGCAEKEPAAPMAASTPQQVEITPAPSSTLTTASNPLPAETTSTTLAAMTTTTTPVAQSIKINGTMVRPRPDVYDTVTMESSSLVVLKGTLVHEWSGTLEGDIIEGYTMKINVTDGNISMTGEGTFTGTVDGNMGTISYKSKGIGQMLGQDAGMLTSSLNIINGTGELSGLSGTINSSASWDATSLNGNYSGVLKLASVPATPTPAPTPDFRVFGTAELTEDNRDLSTEENGIYTGEGTCRHAYHGDMEGEMVIKYHIEVDTATGSRSGTAEAAFTGAVNGKKGTFTATGVEASQWETLEVALFATRYTIVSGTDELSGLHGAFSVSGRGNDEWFSGNYFGILGFGSGPTASNSFDASGDFVRTNHTFETSEAEGVAIYEGTNTMDFHGTLEGTWVNQYRMEISKTTGKLNMTADITFTGNVDGKAGVFTATEVATGQFYSATSGRISGQITINGGTGELAGLRGDISANADLNADGLSGTYTGTLFFLE